eukprot:TRINITY_DN17612_c0_g2_i1.p1 TRINITY_DN17612_c0_g2~~TRINITY_DN17612_c0_g2_i1.p1  ORF type:complete len:258 (-),score=22.53 TRINITY_DN17612_c0_g2_i1:179-952(-)
MNTKSLVIVGLVAILFEWLFVSMRNTSPPFCGELQHCPMFTDADFTASTRYTSCAQLDTAVGSLLSLHIGTPLPDLLDALVATEEVEFAHSLACRTAISSLLCNAMFANVSASDLASAPCRRTCAELDTSCDLRLGCDDSPLYKDDDDCTTPPQQQQSAPDVGSVENLAEQAGLTIKQWGLSRYFGQHTTKRVKRVNQHARQVAQGRGSWGQDASARTHVLEYLKRFRSTVDVGQATAYVLEQRGIASSTGEGGNDA